MNTLTSLDTIERAVAELASGRPVVVVDDADRENEGDLTFAASLATPELMALLVRHTSGYVCAPAAAEILDRLELPLMVPNNQDSLRTAYTVSVDAATGVGRRDRRTDERRRHTDDRPGSADIRRHPPLRPRLDRRPHHLPRLTQRLRPKK